MPAWTSFADAIRLASEQSYRGVELIKNEVDADGFSIEYKDDQGKVKTFEIKQKGQNEVTTIIPGLEDGSTVNFYTWYQRMVNASPDWETRIKNKIEDLPDQLEGHIKVNKNNFNATIQIQISGLLAVKESYKKFFVEEPVEKPSTAPVSTAPVSTAPVSTTSAKWARLPSGAFTP